MSEWDQNQWVKAVLASDLRSGDVRVLLALGMRATWKTGRNAHPSRAKLSTDAGVSERTVKRALEVGVRLGWITVEVPAHRGKSPNVYRLTYPHGTPGGPISGEDGTPRGPISDEDRATECPQVGPPSVPQMGPPDVPISSLDPPNILSLSPAQELARDLLAKDERDGDEDLLKNVDRLVSGKDRPTGYLYTLHKNGHLRQRLKEASAKDDGWGKPVDDGLMRNPGYVEGWGMPEHVRIDDYYRNHILHLGYDTADVADYLDRAKDIHPDGSDEKVWHEAWMTAQADKRLNDTYPEEKTA